MANIFKLAKQGFKSISKYPSGSYGYPFWPRTSSGGYDWVREAGVRYDNSIVFAAIQFAINSLLEAEVCVRRKKKDGTYEEVPNHPIIDLLMNPNPWYDYRTLMSGWVISEMAGRFGMSYTYKHRSALGKVVGLEYIPHFSVNPLTLPGSPNFIDYYQLSVGGGYLKLDPQSILAQRYGPINPMLPQVSYGPLEAVLMEISTDKQAANYTGALLKNVGVTPHMISPSVKNIDGIEVTFTETQIAQLQSSFEERITGDNRGRPLISPLPIDVKDLSFSPNDMNLEGIRNITEERICAVLRIPPGTLNLGTGIENQNNRATAEAIAKQAARDFVVPYYKRKASQLSFDLIPELGAPGEEVYFKYENIASLQEDEAEVTKRNVLACGGPYLTVNEVRKLNNYPAIDGEEFDTVRSVQKPQPDEEESIEKEDEPMKKVTRNGSR